jgi:hypothetical protein
MTEYETSIDALEFLVELDPTNLEGVKELARAEAT